MHSETENVFGSQYHQTAEPHWIVELGFPPIFEDDRAALEAVFHQSGVPIFAIPDPRRKWPRHYANIDESVRSSVIPTLTLTTMDRATSTITVTGTDGDVVEQGDPLGFTLNSARHYFKAVSRTVISGATDIEVFNRPRLDLTSQSIALERVNVPHWFRLNRNDIPEETDLITTSFSLVGTEHWIAPT
jgi:hypothetical protein